MNIKLIQQLFLLLLAVMLMSSCEYEYIILDAPTPPNPGDTTNPVDTVSFINEITPIFGNSNCTGCHSSGSTLDLTPANAYTSLMSNNKAIPFDPENSPIYTVPHPTTGSHFEKYSSVDEANLIYYWIDQGALDN